MSFNWLTTGIIEKVDSKPVDILCEIWVNFVSNSYFVDNCVIKSIIDFQLNTCYFSSKFCVFYRKSPSVSQRPVSQEIAFRKSKKLSPFFSPKAIGSNIYFVYSNWKQQQTKFKVKVHYINRIFCQMKKCKSVENKCFEIKFDINHTI